MEWTGFLFFGRQCMFLLRGILYTDYKKGRGNVPCCISYIFTVLLHPQSMNNWVRTTFQASSKSFHGTEFSKVQMNFQKVFYTATTKILMESYRPTGVVYLTFSLGIIFHMTLKNREDKRIKVVRNLIGKPQQEKIWSNYEEVYGERCWQIWIKLRPEKWEKLY